MEVHYRENGSGIDILDIAAVARLQLLLSINPAAASCSSWAERTEFLDR